MTLVTIGSPRFLVMALFCLAGMCTGCGGVLPGGAVPVQADLLLHRSRWAAQRITSYRYTFQHSGFLAPPATEPVIIQVRDGVRVALTPVNSGATIDAASFTAYDTVEKLFGVIQDAIDHNAAQITVEYDAVRGFPTRIDIDPIAAAADDEIYLRVSQLETAGP